MKEFWLWLRTGCHDIKVAFLTKYARWVDPKLEPYRKKTNDPDTKTTAPKAEQNSEQTEPLIETTSAQHADETPHHDLEIVADTGADQIPAPATTSEFLDLIRRTPKSVLTSRERHVIATIMNFPHVKVSDLMLPQTAITYVHDDEMLGPVTLDRLYRSGFQHFPVLNYDRRIIGLIHTTSLNNLETKETSRAIEILDPKVYYLRNDYTLNQALAAFLRTNCYFFLVVDKFERIVGMLTYEMIVDYILGESPTDDFSHDDDRYAVAKR